MLTVVVAPVVATTATTATKDIKEVGELKGPAGNTEYFYRAFKKIHRTLSTMF